MMRNIFSGISVAFILCIFTFFVDGEIGIILVSFISSALLFSLIFALYSSKRIKVSFDCDAYVKKGNELEVKITIEKKGIFPLSIIEIKPGASQIFSQSNKLYRFSMLKENKIEFKFKILSEIGGNGEIFIESVYSCGFLGFIKFKVKNLLSSPKNVGVIPRIPEISTSSQLFRNISDAVLTSDNDEENDTSLFFSPNTFPGYEHREYVPGDSLKKVNWKLSSKLSKYMVRLDEVVSTVKPCIVLDLYRENNNEIIYSLKNEERLLQAVFGLINLLVNQGIVCSFIYRDSNGTVISENIDSPDYPMQLLLKVLAVKPKKDSRIDMSTLNENNCSYIIATTDTSGSFSDVTAIFSINDNVCAIIPSENNAVKVQIPVWYLTNDNNFKLV